MRSGDLPAYLSLNGPSNGNFMLLMLFCSILAYISSRWPQYHVLSAILFHISDIFDISEIQLVCDRRTDGPTDGRTDRPTDRRTDGRTDRPSYRDARTHLKTVKNLFYCKNPSWSNVFFHLANLTVKIHQNLISGFHFYALHGSKCCQLYKVESKVIP